MNQFLETPCYRLDYKRLRGKYLQSSGEKGTLENIQRAEHENIGKEGEEIQKVEKHNR